MSAVISGYGNAIPGVAKIPGRAELRQGIDRGAHQGPLPASLADVPLSELELPIHKAAQLGARMLSDQDFDRARRDDNEDLDDENDQQAVRNLPRAKHPTARRAPGKRRSRTPKFATDAARKEALRVTMRERWAGMSPEQRREAGQKALASRNANRSAGRTTRSTLPQGRMKTGSPELRAHLAQKAREFEARMTPEEREARSRKRTEDRRRSPRTNAMLSEAVKLRRSDETAETRRALAAKGAAAMHAKRREAARLSLTIQTRCDTVPPVAESDSAS